jgi:hypothetical protein
VLINVSIDVWRCDVFCLVNRGEWARQSVHRHAESLQRGRSRSVQLMAFDLVERGTVGVGRGRVEGDDQLVRS